MGRIAKPRPKLFRQGARAAGGRLASGLDQGFFQVLDELAELGCGVVELGRGLPHGVHIARGGFDHGADLVEIDQDYGNGMFGVTLGAGCPLVLGRSRFAFSCRVAFKDAGEFP